MQAILDSGATITISGIKDNFVYLEPCHIVVECANNERMICKFNGPLVVSHTGHEIVMMNSLYIPGCVTLLSVNQMTDQDFIVMFVTWKFISHVLMCVIIFRTSVRKRKLVTNFGPYLLKAVRLTMGTKLSTPRTWQNSVMMLILTLSTPDTVI
jgi:hypothetical protein